MTEKKTFLIVNTIPNIEEKESFQSYIAQIIDIFQQFGGSNLQRWNTTEQVIGQSGIKAIAVIEFPSVKSIKEMLASEPFNALNDLRKKAYKQLDLMICEKL